jgi:hypothetical protein
MRTRTFGEPFDFEQRFAFCENGEKDDSGGGICAEPGSSGSREGIADPFEDLPLASFECPLCGGIDGDNGMVGGYFDDDGNRIDPDLIPLPPLCVGCRRRDAGDWEEEVLCTLNRLDQADDDTFHCDAFEPC